MISYSSFPSYIVMILMCWLSNWQPLLFGPVFHIVWCHTQQWNLKEKREGKTSTMESKQPLCIYVHTEALLPEHCLLLAGGERLFFSPFVSQKPFHWAVPISNLRVVGFFFLPSHFLPFFLLRRGRERAAMCSTYLLWGDVLLFTFLVLNM